MTAGKTTFTDIAVDSIEISGVSVDTAVLLASGQAVDLNGEAAGLILDAAGNVVLHGATVGHGKLAVSGSTVVDVSAAATALTGTLSVSGITTASGGIKTPVVTISGDGAITIAPFTIVRLSKGSAAAITLAAPTNSTHDGYIVMVFSSTAQAHVITGGVDGFNAKGSSGTITFGGAIGDSVTLVAMGGHWYTLAKVNATVA